MTSTAPRHIPQGFTALVPYLILKDAPGFLDFCRRALGARELRVARDAAGGIQHGEILLEGAALEFGEAKAEWPARPACLHLFVPDADAAFARAVAAGAEVLYPVTDHPYGERSGGVRDPWGNDWYLATVTDPEARHRV